MIKIGDDFMRRYERKKSQYIVGIISIIILALTIGYSFLSVHLKVNGLAHVTLFWDVHFDNIVVNTNSVSLGSEDYSPTIDSNNGLKLNYKVTLTNPGDFYEFTFDIVNAGTIDAMIDTFEPFILNTPENISYQISYVDDVAIENKQRLKKNSVEKIKVRLEVISSGENLPYPIEEEISVNYVIADDTAIRVKHPLPLYSVLEDEANSGSGLVSQYMGAHKDSYTQNGSQNIYHWVGTNGGDALKEKTNVIFANYCWQMIRTTDTGGAKLLYNGKADNNQCLDTRGTDFGYEKTTSVSFNTNFWYGTDFTYDPVNKNFTLAGDVLEHAKITEDNISDVIGTYSCKATTAAATCSTLYYILRYDRYNSADVIKMKPDSPYYQIGTASFATGNDSIAYGGYQYGDLYLRKSANISEEANHSRNINYFNMSSFSTSYYCADSYTYNSNTDTYSLVNATKVSSTSEIPSLVGKYTLRRSTANASSGELYYLVGYSGSMYYFTLKSGMNIEDHNPLKLSTSITKNANNTYTLVDPISVQMTSWFTDFANYTNYYTCGDGSSTCEDMRFITETSKYTYRYLLNTDEILIAKERNGLNLSDTMVISLDLLYKDFDNYSDYIYTCNNLNNVCSEGELSIITDPSTKGYLYAPNRHYANRVEWDGTNYHLIDMLEIEDYNDFDTIKNHHYFCLTSGAEECSAVAFANYANPSRNYVNYILLENGVEDVSDAIDNMINANTNDSDIKFALEAWYQKFLLPYDAYIEDAIYCGDRTITNRYGWDPNGGALVPYSSLSFKAHSDSNSTDLSCNRVFDQFSTSNPSARTKYKIGLFTTFEMNLLGSAKNLLKTGKRYWLMNACYQASDYTYHNVISDLGYTSTGTGNNGVRPAITLNSSALFVDGDGSKESPYLIKTE